MLRWLWTLIQAYFWIFVQIKICALVSIWMLFMDNPPDFMFVGVIFMIIGIVVQVLKI